MKSESPKKRLVIVRHAHRDKTFGAAADNGLSEKGQRQAEALKNTLIKRFSEVTPKLSASEKRRCQETLKPIAQAINHVIHIDDRLMEQLPIENSQDLESRVRDFLKEWKTTRQRLTIACSHGDWIPLATEILIGESIDLRKGGWIEITGEYPKLKITALVQDVLG